VFREDGSAVAMYSMGGLATHCIAPVNAVFPLPDSVPYSDAAIIGCSVFTAFGAVRHGAELRAGETVAVIGSGGVGASVIQIAAAFGASQIIAVDIADDKLEQMRKLGATHTVNSRTTHSLQQSILDLTEQHGVDVCIEALGLPATFQQAAGAVTNGGRAVAIGLARAGVMAELEMNSFVRRGIRVIGSYGGRARQDMPVLLRMLEKGQVDVSRGISRRYKLEQTEQAYKDLQAGNIIGRAIVEMF
jgi:Zn-dependent alcohol dehydrogenase